ncbi:hypothetical protein KND94_001960 [Staphylococcus pseudintermedius]|nr:hypothetical protein [Staphylococcus pseudintermedius]HEC2174146.1 hypothetical protein [Staphylococcus delphini]
METPIKDILREKYSIDLDKKELQELISKQVDQELLKRVDKPDRQKLNLDDYFKDLQQSLVGMKERLSNAFTSDFIMQQVNGVKDFFNDHGINPETIKKNIKDLVTWNKESATVENLISTFDKVRDFFSQEQQQVSELSQGQPLLSSQFTDLKDMMTNSYETINRSADIQGLRNYEQVARLEIINQKLALQPDVDKAEPNYNVESINQNISLNSDENKVNTIDLYNYLRDAQNILSYSAPYKTDNDINKLQLEQFTLQAIQTIEEQISPKELNKSRINHLSEVYTKPYQNSVIDSYIKDINSIEKGLPEQAKLQIQESKKAELEQNNTIKEAYDIQETDVFQILNDKSEYKDLMHNGKDKQVKAELLDVDRDKVIVEVGIEQYALTLNEEDTQKIQNNQDAFTFNFNTDTKEFDYEIDEDAISEHTHEVDNEKKSHTPEQYAEPDPLPPEYIEQAENDAFER